MTADVREVQFKPTVNDSLVEELDALLAMAKRGDLTSGHFAGSHRDGSVLSCLVPGDDVPRDLAAVERLAHRLHVRMDEVAREP